MAGRLTLYLYIYYILLCVCASLISAKLNFRAPATHRIAQSTSLPVRRFASFASILCWLMLTLVFLPRQIGTLLWLALYSMCVPMCILGGSGGRHIGHRLHMAPKPLPNPSASPPFPILHHSHSHFERSSVRCPNTISFLRNAERRDASFATRPGLPATLTSFDFDHFVPSISTLPFTSSTPHHCSVPSFQHIIWP